MTIGTTSPPQNSDDLDRAIQTLTRWNWGLLGLLIVSGLLRSPWFSLSVAVGGAIAIVNFYWLRRQLQGLFSLSPRAATVLSQLRAVVRLAIWGIVIYLALVPGKLEPAGLLLGLSILVINIFILTGIMLFRKGGHT